MARACTSSKEIPLCSVSAYGENFTRSIPFPLPTQPVLLGCMGPRFRAKTQGLGIDGEFSPIQQGLHTVFPSQNQECLLERLKRALEHIGGVPPRLRFDNLSTAVVKVLESGDQELAEGFTRFMLHYRFQADFCNPAAGVFGLQKMIPIDMRLVCSANRNLYKQVRKGKFQEDLLFRLNVMAVNSRLFGNG